MFLSLFFLILGFCYPRLSLLGVSLCLLAPPSLVLLFFIPIIVNVSAILSRFAAVKSRQKQTLFLNHKQIHKKQHISTQYKHRHTAEKPHRKTKKPEKPPKSLQKNAQPKQKNSNKTQTENNPPNIYTENPKPQEANTKTKKHRQKTHSQNKKKKQGHHTQHPTHREVIRPHLPVRAPCYALRPLPAPTLDPPRHRHPRHPHRGRLRVRAGRVRRRAVSARSRDVFTAR